MELTANDMKAALWEDTYILYTISFKNLLPEIKMKLLTVEELNA